MSIRRIAGWAWGSKAKALISSLPLLFGTVGCTGTPLGETLSGSFPVPSPLPSDAPKGQASAPTPEPPVPASGQKSPPPALPKAPVPPKAKEPLPTGAQAAGSAPQRPSPRPSPEPKAKTSSTPNLSSPYRITIRLPLADPSAPAEGVTEALRAAGIPFEVETIERVKLEAATATPPVRPAPPPR